MYDILNKFESGSKEVQVVANSGGKEVQVVANSGGKEVHKRAAQRRLTFEATSL